jgi:hypothetical protein
VGLLDGRGSEGTEVGSLGEGLLVGSFVKTKGFTEGYLDEGTYDGMMVLIGDLVDILVTEGKDWETEGLLLGLERGFAESGLEVGKKKGLLVGELEGTMEGLIEKGANVGAAVILYWGLREGARGVFDEVDGAEEGLLEELAVGLVEGDGVLLRRVGEDVGEHDGTDALLGDMVGLPDCIVDAILGSVVGTFEDLPDLPSEGDLVLLFGAMPVTGDRLGRFFLDGAATVGSSVDRSLLRFGLEVGTASSEL